MSASDQDLFAPLVQQMVAGELADGKRREVFTHVKGCASCQSLYNRLVLAERMLHGGPKAAFTISAFEVEQVATLVLDGATSSAEKMVSLPQRIFAWFSPPRFAAAVGVVALMIAAPYLLRQPSQSEFQSRGGADVRASALRAFCLNASGVASLGPSGSCGIGDRLKLSISNSGKFSHLFLVGMQADHEPRWYAPVPPETASISVATTVGDTPVGGAVQLSVNHEPGTLRIFSIWSDSPVQSSEIETAMETLKRENRTVKESERLPLLRADLTQQSFVIEITP